MNADGSGQTNITNDPNTDDYLPDWSPDGAKIAYSRLDFTTVDPSEVYLMNPDGSGKVNLTNNRRRRLVAELVSRQHAHRVSERPGGATATATSAATSATSATSASTASTTSASASTSTTTCHHLHLRLHHHRVPPPPPPPARCHVPRVIGLKFAKAKKRIRARPAPLAASAARIRDASAA